MPTSAAGIDVGGTTIKSVLLADNGDTLAEWRTATPPPGPAVADRVADAVRDAVAHLTSLAPAPPAAVGLVVPGIVDADAGIAVHSENLGWSDAPLRDMVADRVALPTLLDHDVRAGALAETRIGAGQGLKDTVFVAIGTGVAAALHSGGRLHAGRGYAGEIGHTDVGHDQRCACGATGCLEAIASASAIARRYRTRTGKTVAGASEVLALARDGDEDARTVWHEALDALSRAFAWITSVLAPEAIIVGGGLAEAGDELLEPLAERLETRLTFQRRPRLLKAALGDRAAGFGSALLALQSLTQDHT